MSSNRSSSGGVRNLRAMFEGGGGDAINSPPSTRGRSPAGSESVASNGSNTPRRLSSVRTNFVAVERSGQIGIQLERKPSNEPESFASRRRTSFSLNEEQDPEAMAEVRRTISGEAEKRARNTRIEETIPEVAVGTPEVEKSETEAFQGLSAARPKGSQGDKTTTLGKAASRLKSIKAEDMASGIKASPRQANGAVRPTDIAKLEQSSTNGPSTMATQKKEPTSTTAGPKADPTLKDMSTRNGRALATSSIGPSDRAKSKADAGRTVPILTTTARGTPGRKPALKSPARSTADTPRTPKTPTVPAAAKAGSSRATEPASNGKTSKGSGAAISRPIIRPTTTTTTTTSTTTKAESTNRAAKPREQSKASVSKVAKVPSHLSPPRRTKPWTPTRPVPLPASATAPTASSAAKTMAANTKDPSRSSSKGHGPTNIRRQTSTRQHDLVATSKSGARHSLPVHQAPQRTASRVSVGSKVSDDGFLARMMRPTASSASKTHEKMETKPHGVTRPLRTTQAKRVSEDGAHASLDVVHAEPPSAHDDDEAPSPVDKAVSPTAETTPVSDEEVFDQASAPSPASPMEEALPEAAVPEHPEHAELSTEAPPPEAEVEEA
ncbi:MAG: hypothetical protein M1838_001853 [Thelocarpon superellum]|nr:MAG: hypothetical protein M1838_001853 [Thelocarpon superellum]